MCIILFVRHTNYISIYLSKCIFVHLFILSVLCSFLKAYKNLHRPGILSKMNFKIMTLQEYLILQADNYFYFNRSYHVPFLYIYVFFAFILHCFFFNYNYLYIYSKSKSINKQHKYVCSTCYKFHISLENLQTVHLIFKSSNYNYFSLGL